MKFAIVASEQDIAGTNIAGFIEDLPEYFTDKDVVYAENIDEEQNIKEDFVVFVSRHKGAQEKILSLHAPGNWKKADFGGKEGRVCKTSSTALKTFFKELNKNIPKEWQATLECTHHGPYIEKPCLFIEIGSNKENWKDKEAAKAIAKTIENAVKILQDNLKYKSAIAIGGQHYCPNFNKIQLNSNYAISHIIPEYALPLTEGMLKEAISRTIEPVDCVLLDWKGLGKSEERKQVVEMLERLGIKKFPSAPNTKVGILGCSEMHNINSISDIRYLRTSEIEKD